jgi:hypothetical protein
MTTEPTADRNLVDILPSQARLLPPTALETMLRTEHLVQVRTAHDFPRSLSQFHAQVLSMIRLDQTTAASCFWTLPGRRQKDGGRSEPMSGASIRLAELCLAAWGNVSVDAQVIEENDREVVALGVAIDLQTNVRVRSRVARRIVDREGRRYSDDMIIVTANAAASIAMRNAIFRIIPKVLVDPLVAVAKKVAAGDAKTLKESRQRAVAAFVKLGVSAERLLAKLERPGLDDIDLDDLADLHGLLTAIKDGETTVAQEFSTAPPAAEGGAAPSATAALTERLRRRRRGGQAGEAPAASAPPAPPADEKKDPPP